MGLAYFNGKDPGNNVTGAEGHEYAGLASREKFDSRRRPAFLPPMLIHNAHFWLKKDLSTEDRATFEEEVRRLAAIAYLERGFVGKSAPTEERPVTDHSFDYATSLHFKTMADHEFYQEECKDHARFVAKCKAFFERVIVYDVAPMS
jgi:hypothetical protein